MARNFSLFSSFSFSLLMIGAFNFDSGKSLPSLDEG